MDQLKTSLEPLLDTLSRALELVNTVPKFSTSQSDSNNGTKINIEKIKIEGEIEKLLKETEDLKAKVRTEEQEFKLKETKTNIVVGRIKDARKAIKQLKREEVDLRRRYVESFSLVKQEPVDEEEETNPNTGEESESGASVLSPPRKRRKRVVSMEDEDDYFPDDPIYLIEDSDMHLDIEISSIVHKDRRNGWTMESLAAQRVPVTNPWTFWTENPDFDFNTNQHARKNGASNGSSAPFYRIPKNSMKRELDFDSSPTLGQPEMKMKFGVTGGRRSLGGDADFGCRYCHFRTKYIQNMYRHVKRTHPDGSNITGFPHDNSSVPSLSITSPQAPDDGPIIVPVKKKGKRKKWIVKHQTEDGRIFGKCIKNYVYECKECQYSSAYRSTLFSHIRKQHIHLFTEEEAEGSNKDIDWTKFLNKLKVKPIKVPNDETSEEEYPVKEEPDWDNLIENNVGLVNRLHPGSGDLKTSFQVIKSRRHTKRQPRINVEATYSDFKKSCVDMVQTFLPLTQQEIVGSAMDVSHLDIISFESEAANEGFNFDDVSELCVILKKHATKTFRTYSFKRKSIIEIENNITCDDLSKKLELVSRCKNLSVLAISGLGFFHEQLIETALHQLPSDCPKIEHFIVDDNISIINSYVEDVEDNLIKVLEVHNRAEDEPDMLNVITNCPNLNTIYLDDVTPRLLQAITFRVSNFSMTWASETNLNHFITLAATSNITHFMLDCTHSTLTKTHVKNLANALPELQSISLDWDLDQIHCLKYFNRGHLRSITWDSIPFGVERDETGNMIEELPLQYWMSDENCDHAYTRYNPKRVLSAKARCPEGSRTFGRQLKSAKSDNEAEASAAETHDTAAPLIPSREECQANRPENDEDEKTEVDSQATSVDTDVTEPMETEDVEQSSNSLLDLPLNRTPPPETLSADSDEEAFNENVPLGSFDDYLEYKIARAKLSLELMTQQLGNSLTTIMLTVRDNLSSDIFGCFAKNCPHLEHLSINSLTRKSYAADSFFIPTLLRLETSGIIFRDAELIDILDNCDNLKHLVMEDALNISTNAIRIVGAYSEARLLTYPAVSAPADSMPDDDPCSDSSKIQFRISTNGNDNYDIVNVYDNLVLKFIMKKCSKIPRKYGKI